MVWHGGTARQCHSVTQHQCHARRGTNEHDIGSTSAVPLPRCTVLRRCPRGAAPLRRAFRRCPPPCLIAGARFSAAYRCNALRHTAVSVILSQATARPRH